MLGVRRAGVTVALHYLQNRWVIDLARKQIVITDRDGLKAAANGTYTSRSTAPLRKRKVRQIGLVCRGERQISRVSLRS